MADVRAVRFTVAALATAVVALWSMLTIAVGTFVHTVSNPFDRRTDRYWIEADPIGVVVAVMLLIGLVGLWARWFRRKSRPR